MNKATVQDFSKITSDALSKTGRQTTEAAQDLVKAYQELTMRNMKNMSASLQAMSAVKNPAEFFDVQQRLMRDAVEGAMKDAEHIGKLSSAVFAAAFAPMRQQFETLASRGSVDQA